MTNWSKWYRVWRFYAPLVAFLAIVLFLFAVTLASWLQVPLALVVVVCFVDAVVACVLTLYGLWQ